MQLGEIHWCGTSRHDSQLGDFVEESQLLSVLSSSLSLLCMIVIVSLPRTHPYLSIAIISQLSLFELLDVISRSTKQRV